MSTRDEDTGLMNLGAFSFVVDHVVKRATRAGECATVLSVRVGGPVERRGQRAREGVDRGTVYRIARMLRDELRGEDVVARVGAGEFAVALPDTDADGGEIVVNWIVAQLAEQGIESGSHGLVVGRATFEPTHGPVPADELLEAARRSPGRPCSVAAKPARRAAVVADAGGGARPHEEPPAPVLRHLRALRSNDS